jgi:RHS repeat-associated protein
VATSNQAGAIAGAQLFDAWGNKTASSGTVNQYGFTGREPDETGLVYYRARYYDPAMGRFISRDPSGLRGGINQFAYTNDNPVNLVDPSGQIGTGRVGIAGTVIGAVIGGGVNLANQLNQNNWDVSKVSWSNVGWSAAAGATAGALLTTSYGQTYGGVAGIGGSTNLANYMLTTPPSDYSVSGASIAVLSGSLGGLIGGKAPNPYMFLNPSPNLNDMKLVGMMVAPKILGTGLLGSLVSGANDLVKSFLGGNSDTTNSPSTNASFSELAGMGGASFNDVGLLSGTAGSNKQTLQGISPH